MVLLLMLLLLCAWTTPSGAHREATAREHELFARDGFGRPVAWWAVLKLPMHVRTADGHGTRATPCDCAAPDCSNAPTAELNVTARATGLCYLYADARNPAFQHFRALGYDCLGQGGNDPLSHTLQQLQPQSQHTTSAPGEPYWAIFNDQLNGIARAYTPRTAAAAPRAGAVCGGGNVFSAHAKGAVGFRADSGGFFLQSSTPNFPDPTPPNNLSPSNGSVRLGCQVDNNVQFAQHMFAMSLAMPELNALGAQLQAARLCSGNFYGNATNGLGALLASRALYRDGLNASASRNFSALYAALLDPALPARPQPSALDVTLKQVPVKVWSRVSVFAEPDDGQSLVELNSDLAQQEQASPSLPDTTVHVLVKSPQTAVPPWTLVAASLASDVSAATWWDGGYGIPNVCAGDDYSRARERFCLDANAVFPNGTARFNVENLLEATWRLTPQASKQYDGTDDAVEDALTWHLVGGNMPGGNHAKWGLTTPRIGEQDPARAAVTFADLNMQGFPCSRACNGSQAGRGGAFFSLRHPALHASVADRIVSKACRCVNAASTAPFSAWGPERASNDGVVDAFAATRMCRFGCWRKVVAGFGADELPALAPNATSFWRA